ncbi:hypothetical protein Rhe02_08490 [Rhizocola hellebori]|uniref:Phage tail collar domain-containing protein n=1 Tax=Rhizocola hellebori TaxID=1392758 RepID=A0A8J3Q3Q3_9ACTN|nr:phage tail protein [Rhizocola hellebori]GIH02782.1 hypothetical protein Rhe02_08490 [Rhizocola hellebori]
MEAPPTVPVGSIVAFAGGLDEPWLESQGWLYCDGTVLEQAQYAALYSVIGGNYGAGDGTFFLPDLRGRFTRGADLGAGRDPYAQTRGACQNGGQSGDSPGSLQGSHTAVPANPFLPFDADDHLHIVPHVPYSAIGLAAAGSHYALWSDSSAQTDTAADHTHNVTGGDDESRPVNKYVYFLIKFEDGGDD